MRVPRLLLLWLLGLVIPATNASAQGSIAGRVLADSAKLPIIGAEVRAVRYGVTAVSDSVGRFALRNVPAGSLAIVTRAVGFRPDTFIADILADETVSRDIVLRVSLTTLTEVVVRDSARVPAKLRSFDERRRGNVGGKFLDSSVIVKWENRKTGDLLSTVAGVDVQRQRSEAFLLGSRAPPSLRAGARVRPVPCFMDIYLDGAAIALGNTAFDVNSIGLQHVAVVEVYTGPANTPPQYNRTSSGCGVVLIWTK